MTKTEKKFYEGLSEEDKILYRIFNNPELVEELTEDMWEFNNLHGDSWADDLNT